MREKSREKAKQFSDEEFMVLSAAHFEHFLEYYNIVEEKWREEGNWEEQMINLECLIVLRNEEYINM